MAYVGTPRYRGDDRTTLASIIQGEASGTAGQTAVANVMMNRAATNFGGHGDIMGQALARMQFQGQVPTSQITAGSYAIADQALAGSLPNIVPNSLNYAARQGTTARWALNALDSGQGVNIGGNNFFVNDRGGTPIYNPDAISGVSTPSQGASGLATGDYSNYGKTDIGTNTTSSYTDAQGNVTETWDFGDSGTNAVGGTGNVSSSAFAGNLNTSNPLDPNAASAGGIQPAGAFGLGGASGTQGMNAQALQAQQAKTQTASRSSSSSGGGGGGSSAGGSMTVPQAIDTQTRGNASDTSAINRTNTSNTESTNKTATQNTEALNKTSTANTKSGTDKAQSLYDSTASAWSDYFVRLVFIVVGLIALAAALVMFKPVQNLASAVIPAGRVAKAVKIAKTAL